MRFQEAYGCVLILQGELRFQGLVEQFCRYEPDYMSSGDAIRIWSNVRACLSINGNDAADPDFSFAKLTQYCNNIKTYNALQAQETPVPSVSRDDCLQTLNEDLHTYLTVRGYDEGTQLSFQAIYIDLQELSDLTEAQAQVKAHIRQAWDFVRGIVLPQYYQWKAQLEVIEDFLNYSWDFHALDAADPCVSLRDIMLLLQEA